MYRLYYILCCSVIFQFNINDGIDKSRSYYIVDQFSGEVCCTDVQCQRQYVKRLMNVYCRMNHIRSVRHWIVSQLNIHRVYDMVILAVYHSLITESSLVLRFCILVIEHETSRLMRITSNDSIGSEYLTSRHWSSWTTQQNNRHQINNTVKFSVALNAHSIHS